MKTDILCLADAATLDAAGKLSIFGSYTSIVLRDFPGATRLVVALRLVGTDVDEGVHDVAIHVVDDHRALLTSCAPATMSVTRLSGDAEPFDLASVVVMSVTFPRPGVYWAEAIVDGKRVSKCPVSVREAPYPTAETRLRLLAATGDRA